MAEMPRNATNLQSIIDALNAEGLGAFDPGLPSMLDKLGTTKQPYIPMGSVPGPGARGRNAPPSGRPKDTGSLPIELLQQEELGTGPRGNPIMSPGYGMAGPEVTPNVSGRNAPRGGTGPIDIDNGLGFEPELPPASLLSEQELRELQDGDRSVTPNQRYATRPEARPADLMAEAEAEASGLAPDTSAMPPVMSSRGVDPNGTTNGETLAIPGQATRTTGKSGKPKGLAEDAEDAEKELNFMQRFMRDKLGMDTPEERQRAATALAQFGATLASTPGNFLEGFSAATNAGMTTFNEEEQRALDNDQKRELMDLKREEAAAARANDALAQETARLKIAALKRTAAAKTSINPWDDMRTEGGQRTADIYDTAVNLGLDPTDPKSWSVAEQFLLAQEEEAARLKAASKGGIGDLLGGV